MADPIASIPGISSGIDWTSVVDQMIATQKRPATRLQATIDANAKRRDALELFGQAMSALQNAAKGLRTGGKALDVFTVRATGADATGRNVLAATVGTGAAAGTYDVNVTALATAQKTVAATGWTAAKTLSANATLDLGGAGKTVDLKAGDTLAAIRDRINAQSAKTGVQASILSMNVDGSDQRLVLTGQKTGAVNAFTVADGTSGALVSELGFDGTNVVTAGDASFTLDGGSTPVRRPTNLVTDAIPGVTLTLTARGTSTVSVERQDSAGATAIQAFVDAYNKVQSLAKSQASPGGVLANDSLLRTVRGTLANLTLGGAARVDNDNQPTAIVDDMTALGALGLAVQKDGSLTFDQAKFDTVYPSRMGDVKALLADRMDAFFYYADGITGTYTGAIDKREAEMTSHNASVQARIDTLTARLDKKRSVLLLKYAKFESSLARLNSLSQSLTTQFTGLNKSKDS